MAYEIRDDRLVIDKVASKFVKATASGERIQPTLIILHDTADRPAPEDTVRYFASAGCKVSAHVVVERDGSITQMVNFDRKAMHAGESTWNGKRYCNSYAIGIEIDNPGKCDKNGRAWFHKDKYGRPIAPGFPMAQLQRINSKQHSGDGWWMAYTPEQIAAVTQLCQALVAAYPTIKEIATHYLVSPGRKVDTNPLFPLEEVRAAVFAPARLSIVEWPRLSFGDSGEKVRAAQERLAALGYPVGSIDADFGTQTRIAVLAFEAENNLTYDGELNIAEHKFLMSSADVKPMPVSARENITAEDLKERGSTIVTYTGWGKTALRFLFGGTIVGAGTDASIGGGEGAAAVLNAIDTTRASAERVVGMAAWVITPTGIGIALALVCGYGLYKLFDWIEASRVDMAKKPSVIR